MTRAYISDRGRRKFQRLEDRIDSMAFPTLLNPQRGVMALGAIDEARAIIAETEANSHIHEHAFGVTCCVSLRAASPVFAALAEALSAFVADGVQA